MEWTAEARSCRALWTSENSGLYLNAVGSCQRHDATCLVPGMGVRRRADQSRKMRGIAVVPARRVARIKVGAVKLERSCGIWIYFKPLFLKPGSTFESLGELLRSTDAWAPPPETLL